MGDSFVWGDGLINVNDIWSRKLSSLIKQSGSETEVIDFGKNGWSTLDQFTFLKDEEIKFDPNLIIWGFVTNDPDNLTINTRHTIVDKLTLILDMGLTFFRLFPDTKRFLLSQTDSILRTYIVKDCGYGPWEKRLYEKENLKHYSSLLSKLSQFHNDLKTPFFFVTLPNSPNEEFPKKYRLIKPIMEKNRIPFLDLYPKIKAKFGHIPPVDWKFELSANPANGHPGKRVTQVYAEEVFKYLKKYYPEYLFY